MTIKLLTGDCRATLPTLAAGSVQAVITSPPYYGLRDYGTPPLVWGGDAEHEHTLGLVIAGNNRGGSGTPTNKNGRGEGYGRDSARGQCCPCGAWLGSLGLEPTPELFIEHLVEVFRHVRRVLAHSGTVWLNLGDSYNNRSVTRKSSHQAGLGFESDDLAKSWREQAADGRTRMSLTAGGLKEKDLLMMPFRVAMALQNDGWYLRSVIPWLKRNCLSGGTQVYVRSQKGDMPMSVKDMARLNPSTVQLWNGERWTRVMNVWRVEPETDTLELQLRSGETIGCTPEHRWPTLRGLLTAADLRVGDVIQSTQLPPPEQPHSPAGLDDEIVGWFVGLYIAEGSMSGGTIQIASHTKELDRQRRLQDLARAYDGACFTFHKAGQSMTINLSGPVLRGILDAYVHGEGSGAKHLTSRAWQRSDVFLRAVLDGYLTGDGHWDAPNQRWRLGFCENDRLAQDIRAICARLGFGLRLKRAKHQLDGRILPGWRGQIRIERNARSVGAQYALADDTEIVGIGKSKGRSFWDIEVADDPHLFSLASGVLTHNSMPESVTDRPATAVEYVFLLSKSARYFWDADGVRASSEPWSTKKPDGWDTGAGGHNTIHRNGREAGINTGEIRTGRNRRNSDWFFESWQGLLLNEQDDPLALVVNPAGYSGSHFATFPVKLVEPMVKESTSEKGQCPECGAPWVRAKQRGSLVPDVSGYKPRGLQDQQLGRDGVTNKVGPGAPNHHYEFETTGWRRSCTHYDSLYRSDLPQARAERKREQRQISGDWWRRARRRPGKDSWPVKAQIVLDPFGGAGTVGLVADRLQRNAILCELKPEYADMGSARITSDAPMFADVEGGRDAPPTGKVTDKQGSSGLRRYTGFNARWDAKDKDA